MLFRTGALAQYIYIVRTGSAKTKSIQYDGTEQVDGLYLPPDILGLDALANGRYPNTGIVAEESSICAIRLSSLFALMSDTPDLQSTMMTAVSRALVQREDLHRALSATHADTKVGYFLKYLSKRYRRIRQDWHEFRLPLQQQETASYLGLRKETVSRALKGFQQRGCIEFQGREIRIVDAECLERFDEPGS